MTQNERHERLVAELEAMRALKKSTSILDFEFTGEPPDRYSITLRGKGISRDTSSRADVEFVELHKIDLRLPYSFPRRPPDIRWITPIFHPNISFSGFINLKDIGKFIDGQSKELATAFGRPPNEIIVHYESFATALIVYFFVVGLIQGYLLTRMFLTWQFEMHEEARERDDSAPKKVAARSSENG